MGGVEDKVPSVTVEGREGTVVPMVRIMSEDLMGRDWLLVQVRGAKSPSKTAWKDMKTRSR